MGSLSVRLQFTRSRKRAAGPAVGTARVVTTRGQSGIYIEPMTKFRNLLQEKLMAIIVSLTTTSARLKILRYTLPAICSQRLRPDKIILNLSREPYLIDEGIIDIPVWLTNLQDDRLVIKWVPNTGSYRKLLPIITEVSDSDYLVTCDDDVIYDFLWLEKLIDFAESNPLHIACGCGRLPIKNFFQRLQGYENWPVIENNLVDINILPIGACGVVYRRPLLMLDFLIRPEFSILASRQDDIWFKFASFLKGTKVAVVNGVRSQIYPVKIENNLSLKTFNLPTVIDANWRNPVKENIERLTRRLSNYSGMATCGNDVAWQKVSLFASDFMKRTIQTERNTISSDVDIRSVN